MCKNIRDGIRNFIELLIFLEFLLTIIVEATETGTEIMEYINPEGIDVDIMPKTLFEFNGAEQP